MPASRIEKLRVGNKLGYQRTSIACEHCRRRKIRCLVREGDPTERCENCTRLQRSCKFTPIDRRRGMEDRLHPTDRSGRMGIIPDASLTTSFGSTISSTSTDADAVSRPGDWRSFICPPVLRSNDPGHPGGLLTDASPSYFGQGPSDVRRDSYFHYDDNHPLWPPSGSLPQAYAGKTAPIYAASPEHWQHSQAPAATDYTFFPTVPPQPAAQPQPFLFPFGQDRMEAAWQAYPSPVGTISNDDTTQLLSQFCPPAYAGPTIIHPTTHTPLGPASFSEQDMVALSQGHATYVPSVERQRFVYPNQNDMHRNLFAHDAAYHLSSAPRYVHQ